MKKNGKIVATALIIGAITLTGVGLTRELVNPCITKSVAKYETAQVSTTEDGRFEYSLRKLYSDEYASLYNKICRYRYSCRNTK